MVGVTIMYVGCPNTVKTKVYLQLSRPALDGQVDPSEKGHEGAGSYSNDVFALDLVRPYLPALHQIHKCVHGDACTCRVSKPMNYVGSLLAM